MKLNIITGADLPDQVHVKQQMCSRNTKLTAICMVLASLSLWTLHKQFADNYLQTHNNPLANGVESLVESESARFLFEMQNN